MPDLTCVVDGEAEDVTFGTNMETQAEDTSPALGMNTSATGIDVTWVNASGVVCQPANGYLEFDTSGITTTPSSATLKIYISNILNSGPEGIYVMRAFFASAGSLSATDQASYTRDASGATPDIGDMVKYSSEITSFTDDQTLEITLNATALSDMVSRDDFQIAIVTDSLADQHATPSNGITRTITFSSQNNSTSSQRPVLSYTILDTSSPNLNIKSGILTLKPGASIIIKQ